MCFTINLIKGGVVALAACGIGLKKADKDNPHYDECKDLILASVVHACQDHNQVSVEVHKALIFFRRKVYLMNVFLFHFNS